ncbi:unnamed protein product, partial [Scytosiphon promiscuus]
MGEQVVKNSLGFALAAALLATTADAGERVGDFALIDHQGAFQHLAWYDDQSAVVILPLSDSASDAATLNTLKQQYATQGVEFFLLNPGLYTDRDRAQAEMASLGLDLPVLMDDTQLVTEMLGLNRLDEAVLYDPSSFELVYRGPIEGIETSLQQL